MELEQLKRCTNLLVEADVTVGLKGVEKPQKITVKNLPRVWLWDYSNRHSQELFAVIYWMFDTFPNNLEWYEIDCVVSSPVKDGEDAYPMLVVEVSDEAVAKAMEMEKEVVWGRGDS